MEFVGASRDIRDLYQFLRDNSTQDAIFKFLTTKNVNWKFIPQQAPRFGGLWEAPVKSIWERLSGMLSLHLRNCPLYWTVDH